MITVYWDKVKRQLWKESQTRSNEFYDNYISQVNRTLSRYKEFRAPLFVHFHTVQSHM